MSRMLLSYLAAMIAKKRGLCRRAEEGIKKRAEQTSQDPCAENGKEEEPKIERGKIYNREHATLHEIIDASHVPLTSGECTKR